MRVALVGDAFTDRYVFGNVERISPEAPVPILDVESVEERPGGVLNVAANLLALGIEPTVFTISDYKLNCKIVSPLPCTSLKKTRLMASDHQLLRVDNPKVYYEEDLSRMEYPSFEDFDIIAFVDYNKGVINGGVATIVDSKKNDLSVFKGTEYLKINQKEFSKALNTTGFKYSFITKGEDGIDYYKNGVLDSSCGTKAKKIVDVTGAGDTVMAMLIYCLVNKIEDPNEMMNLANIAASIVIAKVGTSTASLKEVQEYDQES